MNVHTGRMRALLAMAVLGLVSGWLTTASPAGAQRAVTTGIGGRVVDPDGAPIGGAWIVLTYPEGPSYAATVADGTFSFPYDLPAGTYDVATQATNHRPATPQVDVVDGAVTDVEIVLDRGRAITGVVTDVGGVPVPGVWVQGYQSGERGSAKTATDGSFTMSGFAPGSATIAVSGHDVDDGTVVVPTEGDGDAGTIVVEPRPVTTPIERAITSTLSDTEVVAGQSFRQHLAVTGIPTGTTATVTEELPVGVELVSATWGWFGRPCTVERPETGHRFACTIPSGAASFVTVVLRSEVLGDHRLVADVDPRLDEQDFDNNTTRSTFSVVAEPTGPDLRVEAVPSESEVLPGERFTHTYLVSNDGGTAATGATLLVEPPAGATLVSAATGWWAVPCAPDGAASSCDLGRIDSGAGTFVVVTLDAGDAGTASTTATATTTSGPSSATASATATVVETTTVPDVRIDQRQPTVFVDKFGTYPTEVHVTSDGPRPATDVVVTVEVPDGVVVDAATIGFFRVPCAVDDGLVTCAVGELRGEQVITIAHWPQYTSAFHLRSSVTAAADRDPSNNTDEGSILPLVAFD